MASKAGRLKQKALSVVDSVHTLGSHNSSNSCTITVKSCPQRSAAEMTKLSVRRGWMLKRNEQRAWQRRYCCLVPHTFLYYFESKDSEVPRGVIDLEAYTDIGVEESTGAIVLGPGPDAPPGFRKFYFRPEDNTVHRSSRDSRFLSRSKVANSSSSSGEGAGGGPSMREEDVEFPAGEEDGVWEGIGDGGGGRLGEWLSGLHRERFKVVRDERDAYMNLQEEYMTQMQDTTSAMSEAESERGRVLEGLRAEHAAARAAARDGLQQARALFREEELPQEEAASLPLPALLARVRAVASERRSREAELEEELSLALAALGEARSVEGESRGLAERLRSEAEEATERARNAEARIRRAEEEASRERALRATAESSFDGCNQRLQAATVDLEQGQVNLVIMAGERRAALAKTAELVEQKRLLVREVKALRRSLAEASSVNRSLARAYESLDQSLRTSSSVTTTTTSTTTKEDTSTEMENRGSLNPVPGTSAAGSTPPAPPSPPSSSVGSLGGVDEWRDWREVRSFASSQHGGPGGVGVGKGKGREGNEEAAAVPGFQFRNLSTGDVDVFDPAGVGGGGAGAGGRERAATDDSGQTADSRAPPPLSAWQPHPSNIGLKITQSLANASWPWASSKSAGSGAGGGGSSFSTHGSSDEPKLPSIPAVSPPEGAPPAVTSLAGGETSGEIGAGSRGSEGMPVSVDDSNGTFSMGAIVGVSGGRGARTRSGIKDVVPSLSLDDDDVGVVEGGPVTEGVDENVVDSSVAGDVRGGRAGAGAHVEGGVNGYAAVDKEKGKEGEETEEMEKGTKEKEGGGNVREGTGTGGVVDVGGALRCHACGGTVEGPRHSTCACEVPDLGSTPEAGSRGHEATLAIQTAPAAAVPVAATSVGFSKLKGVFKSFNGKVEVARQMLDSAVRQNIADNIPRSHLQPSTPASTDSKQSKTPALSGTNIVGSTHGSSSSRVAESSGEMTRSSDGVPGGSGGMTKSSDGSSGMMKCDNGMAGRDGMTDIRGGITKDEYRMTQGSGEITDSNDGMAEGSIGMGEEDNETTGISGGISKASSGMAEGGSEMAEDSGGMARESSEVTEGNSKTAEGSSSSSAVKAGSTNGTGVRDGCKEGETDGACNDVIEPNKASIDSVDETDAPPTSAGLETELEESSAAESAAVSDIFSTETARRESAVDLCADQDADIEESPGKVPQVVSLAEDDPSLSPSPSPLFVSGSGDDRSTEAPSGSEPTAATST